MPTACQGSRCATPVALRCLGPFERERHPLLTLMLRETLALAVEAGAGRASGVDRGPMHGCDWLIVYTLLSPARTRGPSPAPHIVSSSAFDWITAPGCTGMTTQNAPLVGKSPPTPTK